MKRLILAATAALWACAAALPAANAAQPPKPNLVLVLADDKY